MTLSSKKTGKMNFQKKIRHRNICCFQPTNKICIDKKKKNEFKIDVTMCIFEKIVLLCYIDFVLLSVRTSEHSNLA